MAHRPGNGLLLAGTILSVIGLCVVLLKVWHVPAYWVPLLAGRGRVVLGLVRRVIAGSGDPREDRRSN